MTKRSLVHVLDGISKDPNATKRAETAITHRANRYAHLGIGSFAAAIAEQTATPLTSRQLSVVVEAVLMVDYLEGLAIENTRKTNHKRKEGMKM